MEKVCVNCRSARVESECVSCSASVCRKCRVELAEETFVIARNQLPADLKLGYYCSTCFNAQVEPILADYQSTLEKAKNVVIIFKNSKSNVRILRKALKTIELTGSRDRDEAILSLAFQAAKAGFNSLLNVEVAHKKVRNEGYQTTAWEARGLPAEIQSHELTREDT